MGCCLTVATVAFADIPTKVDSMKVINLQEVQVVSTRASQKTPTAYSNISKKVIKAQNFGQDIPFLLQLTPSVISSSDAGAGIGYTGIHIRGTDPTRINITTNGIPVNDAESNNVYWVNMAMTGKINDKGMDLAECAKPEDCIGCRSCAVTWDAVSALPASAGWYVI